MVVEIDRFDVGRTIASCLQPTALLPDDVIIYCTVSIGIPCVPMTIVVCVCVVGWTWQRH